VFGRAGSGKSTLCLEEIRSELRIKPWGAPLILLVPEQATYQMEVTLANTPDLGGSLRAQVLSFRRLGWRVFSETGGGQKVLIGAIGKRMLLRRILLKASSSVKGVRTIRHSTWYGRSSCSSDRGVQNLSDHPG